MAWKPPDQRWLIRIIEQYSNDALRNKIKCDRASCPRCDQASHPFKRHQGRARNLRVIADLFAVVVQCVLIRWKCPLCGVTFTQYPGFVLPRKRYALPAILCYVSAYLFEPAATYRGLCLQQSGRASR